MKNSYDSLNILIDTIEKNLENDINYNELAKVIGTSSYTMQRIFVFLTGITLTEYIRKRRLTKAAEELIKTNNKIIDIAIKYQYNSPISFSNAFKKMHGQSPANFRKLNTEINFFPKIEFTSIINQMKNLKYKVIERKKQTFYGRVTDVIKETDKQAIANLYDEARKDGTMDFMINNSKEKELYYGIYESIYEKGKYTKKGRYYLVGTTPNKNFVQITLPKTRWACFEVPNKEQEEINKWYRIIFDKWLSVSQYEENYDCPELEIYYKDYCEICIPVK